jgi:hypothetical protein
MLYDALVTERNSAWVESLERMLGDGHRYLVVVGALHLVGTGSVIEKLGARGHRVERLSRASAAAGSRGWRAEGRAE